MYLKSDFYENEIIFYVVYIRAHWQLFLEFISKIKFGDLLIQLQNNLSNWGIYNLNSVLISRVLRNLAS